LNTTSCNHSDVVGITKESRLQANRLFENDDLNGAKLLFEAMIAIDSNDVKSFRSLARIHTRLGDKPTAIKYWEKVLQLRPEITESSLQIARLHYSLNNRLGAHKAYRDYLTIVPNHVESIQKIQELDAYADNFKGLVQYSDIQHIALVGVSYCGSTLLSRMLGNVNGVENVGESHWLTSKRAAGSGSAIDFELDDSSVIPECFTCSYKCSVFTHEFRKKLQDNPINWYFKIARQLKGNKLVSADKNYVKLKKLDPTLTLDAVVLFKNPVQAWYSNYRKIGENSDMNPISCVDQYMKAWTRSYTKFLDEFPNSGKKIFLSFDHFSKKPEQHMSLLLAMLNLDCNDINDLQKGDKQHYFGGNLGVNRSIRYDKAHMMVKPLPKIDLPENHIEAINSNDNVKKVYERLIQKYNTDFQVN